MSHWLWDNLTSIAAKVTGNQFTVADANLVKQSMDDARTSYLLGEIRANPQGATGISAAGASRRRFFDGREQVSENGGAFHSVLDGANVADVRDFATGMFAGSATQDTAGLVAAAAFISSASDSTSPKPGVVKFPRGTLLLNTPLTIYGSNSSASAWIGVNGRSRGPDGTVIQWAGGNSMNPMLHLMGMNAFLFKDICLYGYQDATHLARFLIWAETNQRNGGAASSGINFENCWLTGWGNLGAAVALGDETRATVTVSGVSGTFVPGEFLIDNLNDGVATVLTWNGTNTLYIGQLMGSSFTTGSATVTGLTSGATATISSTVTDPSYLGTYECSEVRFKGCGFQAPGIADQTDKRAAWAGVATLGGGNNKDYYIEDAVFAGSRYGVDTGANGSAIFKIDHCTAGGMGHAGKGFLFRFGSNQATVIQPEFENGPSGFQAGFIKSGSFSTLVVIAGEMYGLLPSDNFAIKASGELIMLGTHLGADTGNAQVQVNGQATLIGVGWRENFTGYLPLYDSSGNTLGLQAGNSDNARNNDRPITTLNCISNCAGNAVVLPDIQLRPLSPLRNQLNDNGISNNTVVHRGQLSCSDEVRTIGFANVKAQSGSNDIALTPAKAVIRGIILDLGSTFTGGSLSAVTMSVGIDSNHTKYMGATDVFTATGQFTTFTPVLAPWGGDYLKAFFTFTGDVVANLATGSVTIYVLYEKL